MIVKKTLLMLSPLVLLGVFLTFFFREGPLGVIKTSFPPVEEVAFERVVFKQGRIQAHIVNDGADVVTISQVLVNDAYSQFAIEPGNTLAPATKATVTIDYPWVANEPVAITLLSQSGATFTKEVDIAFLSPAVSAQLVRSFALIGFYVGVIPVFLGFLWFPFLRTLHTRFYHFFLSLTCGLLLFLAVDAAFEAFELLESVPKVYNGVGLILLSFLAVLFLLLSLGKRRGGSVLSLAYLIALAIGIHNFGEGLAIGAAYSVGHLGLGTVLIVGFMVHNATEGVAIAAPLARLPNGLSSFFGHFIGMGMIAGTPTILGTWIGGFSYSNTLAVVFFAVGAAAALAVVIEIVNYMRKPRQTLLTFTNGSGIILGLLIMYVTSLLVLS